MSPAHQKTISVYVLRLQDEKYYVGQSKHPDERIKEHFEGKGSKWTQEHSPVELVKVIQTVTTNWRAALEIEKTLTLELMKVYGWKNVRGGGYSVCNLAKIPKELT